jgi:hypothetical protein
VTSRDFCFWLQGYLELRDVHHPEGMSEAQLATVKQHLALVFKHEIDPSMGDKVSQAALDALHTPPNGPPGGSGPTFRC